MTHCVVFMTAIMEGISWRSTRAMKKHREQQYKKANKMETPRDSPNA